MVMCNEATTELDGEDLDISDYIYWQSGSDTYTACAADADCSDDETCATHSIDTLSGGWCVEMDAEEYGCGTSNDIANSLNTYDVACSGDRFDGFTWRTTNEADQDGACDSSLADFDAATDECAAGTTCGTATFDGMPDYFVIGCYPDLDCSDAATGATPLIPDSETVTYLLTCGAAKLFATAAAAVAVATSI